MATVQLPWQTEEPAHSSPGPELSRWPASGWAGAWKQDRVGEGRRPRWGEQGGRSDQSPRGRDEACVRGSCVNVGVVRGSRGATAKALLGAKVEDTCLLTGMCWQLGQCPGTHDAMWLQV